MADPSASSVQEAEDEIMAQYGFPPDWREEGWDTTETMVRVYQRTENGAMVCPWPRCNFTRTDKHVLSLFRHAHHPHGHGRVLPITEGER